MGRLSRKFLLILIFIGSTYGIEHLNFIGGWSLGICRAVALDPERKLAFVGSGSTLLIYDISGLEESPNTKDINPIPLREISRISLDSIYIIQKIKYSSQKVFISDLEKNKTVTIVDVSDPYNPYVLGTLPPLDNPYWYVSDFAVKDSFVFVTFSDHGNNGRFAVYSISDPRNPQRVFIEYGDARGKILIYRSLAFVIFEYHEWIPGGGCYDRHGVEIWNINDPHNPSRLSTIENSYYSYITSMCVRQYNGILYLYIADLVPNYIDVYKLLIITNPQYETQFPISYSARNIFFRDSLLYMLTPWGFIIFNSPSLDEYDEITRVDENLKPYQIDTWGKYLFVAYQKNLSIYNINDPYFVSKTYIKNFPEEFCSITLNSALILLGIKNEGIFVLDGANFDLLSKYPLDNNINDEIIKGNNAFIATNDSELVILDISNPYFLQEIARYRGIDIRKFYISNNYLYTALGPGGLKIFDVSDPSNIHLLAEFDQIPVYDLAVSDNYIYAITDSIDEFQDSTRISILYYNSQNNYIELTSNLWIYSPGFFVTEFPISVEAENNKLVTINDSVSEIILDPSWDEAVEEHNFRILYYDISAPQTPQLMGVVRYRRVGSYLETTDHDVDHYIPAYLKIWQDRAFAVFSGLIKVFYLNDTLTEEITGSLNMKNIEGMAIFSNQIYLIDRYAGLRVYECDLLSGVEEIVNEEKNSAQIIGEKLILNFAVKNRENVEIHIFDVSGRKIKSVKKVLKPGLDKIEIHIQKSGIYFYQIKTPETVKTGQFVIIK